MDDAIRITCTGNQVVDVKKLKKIYRSGSRFREQHGAIRIIVDTDRKVRLSARAEILFNRWSKKINDLTIVIIAA